MMRRPPGEGNVVKRSVLLAIAILLIPWIVEAQQSQQRRQQLQKGHESPHEAISVDAHTFEATRLAQHAKGLETPLNTERRKNTLSVNNHNQNINNNNNNNNKNDYSDASAIATLAPAKSAVRAPPPRRSSIETAGLSSPQLARSLEDWEVEDFVLLATVDGHLYARDRKTGKERWNLEVDKPMIETTYHRRNRSSIEEDYREYDDYMWIVEPSRDGSLFVYVPAGPDPGLVNTGLTMKKLVEEMSPYAGVEPPVVYTGDKKTTMVTLDAASGKVLKWFGSSGALVNDETCLRTGGLVDTENDECSTAGTLTLGRVEYTVGIQGKDGRQIATLKYSEWGPNNYDHDLHRQYRTTLDSKYVYSNYDGSIFGYDYAHTDEPGKLFKQKFSSPVVRVFDIARPWGTENNSPDLVVLPQPLPPGDDEEIIAMRRSRIFLNHTEEGSWYAMSGNTYPLIVDGPERAQCDTRDWWQHGPIWENMNAAQLSKAMVGLHSIDSVKAERLLTISAPDDQANESATVRVVDVEEVADSTSVLDQVKQLPQSAWKSLFDFVKNPIMKIIIVALLAVYYKDLLAWINRTGIFNKENPTLTAPMAAEDVTDIPTALSPTPDIIEQEKEKEEEKIDEAKSVDVKPVEALVTETIIPSTTSSDDVAVQAEKTPSPPEKLAEITIQDPLPAPTPEKKKAHRGRRGGVKHKPKKNRNNLEVPSDQGTKKAPTVEDAVRDAQKLGETPKGIEPDVQTINNGVTEVSGPVLRMGSLTCNTEKLIGTGSNGTMVFEGTFDGRDVAVKRMLIQFFDIASQETKLLRESDDHPNVIRYYAQQQSSGFLYIALELCPASLADVIEKPHLHRSLAQAGEQDLPGVLYQITNGLSHLHSLRIVHRDLKPQNILVAQGKNSRPRLLVSDFGLCKKLDGEQSSFRATTAHAAGTSGWRAPELLLDDDNINEPPSLIDASTHSGSGALLAGDSMPLRRATRAIDIFSLGLVFFYVLTKGCHPFDCGDRYMREVNIRKGKFDLLPLEVLGDYYFEAQDLISSMLEAEPKRRPSARQVMAHPFFWSPKKRLNFLCDVSDHFEKEVRIPPSPALQELEGYAPIVCGNDFLKPLGKEFVESLGKQRKYTGTKLLDLLRALRNKRNHYEDMSDKLKEHVGSLPEGYLSFWTRKFPDLLITCWNVVYDVRWDDSDRFREYYEPNG